MLSTPMAEVVTVAPAHPCQETVEVLNRTLNLEQRG